METDRTYYSYTGQSAYIDLIRLLKDNVVSHIRGTPLLRTRNGKKFWYDRYRVGDSIAETYLGPDTKDLKDRISTHKTLQEQRKLREAEQARLIRILRAEGYRSTDQTNGKKPKPL